MVLELTDSGATVDLSGLTQDLTFDPASNTLGLTQSNDTIDLSHLLNEIQDEPQSLSFSQNNKMLSLSRSNATVDLSSLIAPPQGLRFSKPNGVLSLSGSTDNVDLSDLDKGDLEFNKETKELGLTNSNITVDLSSLIEMDPELLEDGKTLEMSRGGNTVDLSPLRLATIQGTIDKIDGKDTSKVTIRNLASGDTRGLKKGDDPPEVGHGGLKHVIGWTIINSGRLVGMSISAISSIKPESGALVVRFADCAASERLGQQEDVLTLGPGEGRWKKVNFDTPIEIQEGLALCIYASRSGKIDSFDGKNAANILVLMEQ